MAAPVKHTCPDIDDLQTDVMSNAKMICDELEKLRKANASLRDWGEDLENELDDANSLIGEQREEIKDLENHVDDLKSELRELEHQIKVIED